MDLPFINSAPASSFPPRGLSAALGLALLCSGGCLPRPSLAAAGVRGARAAQGLRAQLRGTSAPAPRFPLLQVSKEVLSVLLISVPERCFLPLWLFSCKTNKNVKFSLLRAHRDFFDDSVTCLGRFLSL